MSKENQSRRKDKEWREFEKLIARIENHLAGEGVIVKSPDRIEDKETGTSREVDASIRYTVGSAPILIIIECRNRKGNEDVTWIEQLSAKRTNIGADKTIAVSSSGFSQEAIEKANLAGIELRKIDEISDKEILDLVGISKLEIYRARTYIEDPHIGFDLEADENLDLRPSLWLEQTFLSNWLDSPIIKSNDADQLISLRNLLNITLAKAEAFPTSRGNSISIPAKERMIFGGDLFDALCSTLLGVKPQEKIQIKLGFNNPDFSLETVSGVFVINSIDIVLVVRLERQKVDGKYYEYSTGNDQVVKHLGEAQLKINDQVVNITWSSDEEGQE